MPWPERWKVAGAAAACAALFGCSGKPSRLHGPKFEAGAGQKAIDQYDTNNDGMLAGEELNRSPGLKDGLPRLDANGDGRVTAHEIEARIAKWEESKIALMQLMPTVLINGQPLVDADVMIVPETFLGPNVKAARGKTDARGKTNLQISPDRDEAGVHLGFYRVEISKKIDSRGETIASKYNAQSELGLEVASDNFGLQSLQFNLVSP